jgi:hypothetical protein
VAGNSDRNRKILSVLIAFVVAFSPDGAIQLSAFAGSRAHRSDHGGDRGEAITRAQTCAPQSAKRASEKA